MTEYIWLNGDITPLNDAKISVEDRGYQFADGVYEVVRIYDGKAFALEAHLKRFEDSARAIHITIPYSPTVLAVEMEKIVHKNGVTSGIIYAQVSRGVSKRNHLFPTDKENALKPTLLFYARSSDSFPPMDHCAEVNVVSADDERWKRCWIKSIALLPNVLAKNDAVARGADEAVFIDGGQVTECSSCNIHALINGRLVSPPPGPKVLPGITRLVLLECANRIGLPIDERHFTPEEAFKAEQLLLTSTTREISWVRRWDGRELASKPTETTMRLHEAFREIVTERCVDKSTEPRSQRVAFGCRA